MDILAPYLPTIVLVLIAIFTIGADFIKNKNIYADERKRKRQDIIDEYKEEVNIQQEFKSLHDRFDELNTKLSDLGERMESAEQRLDDLTKSDMHDIKCWIVDQYQRFYVDKGWIDAFHAETIDRRYEDYKNEGGNSYIETLIERLHGLPMDPKEKNDSQCKNKEE